MKKAFLLGIGGSFFFAFTFILNRSMNLAGGAWMWTAPLRYLFTLPMAAIILLPGNKLWPVIREIARHPVPWFLWSTVGFCFFYGPMSFASVFGESWFISATWQLTIVMGVLLTPLFGQKIPRKNLLISLVILVGVGCLQAQYVHSMQWQSVFGSLIPIMIGALCYPLGNRMMMRVAPKDMSTMQRVFGMTLCSTPVWIVMSVVAFARYGVPSENQLVQSVLVALFAGVIATILFFKATDLVRNNAKQLAIVEATQAGEVVFTLIGGVLLLGDSLPTPMGILGLILIIGGMIGNSLV